MNKDTETREFHIGDVISAATGVLVSPRHVEGVYDVLGFMTGSEPMTHQLPRLSRECEPSLRAQFPELVAEQVVGVNSQATALAFLETLYPKYGVTVTVRRLPVEDHTDIDPITELRMMRPDATIITVEGSPS